MHLSRPVAGSLYALLVCCRTPSFADGVRTRGDEFGMTVAVPSGLRVCASKAPEPGREMQILLDGAGTCDAGVPKRVVVVEAEPNVVGAARPSELERFFCRSGAPLPVPLLVARALRPGDDACSYRRGAEIAVWVLRQRGPGGGINYELGLLSDLRHYAFDLLAYRNVLVRVSFGRPSSG